MEKHHRVELNSFATECFRNVADADYISARISYRLGLIHQFQWCALQAIEKYLKAILLYNQKSAKGLSHNLEASLERVLSIEAFDIELEEYQKKLIVHLSRNAQNRYLEQHTYTLGEELLHLDSTVWSIRRYCRVLNYEITDTKGEIKNMLELELAKINSEFYKENPHKFLLIGGFLEKVLERKKGDELRKALVWKNFRYGKHRKRVIKNFTFKSVSHIPPHVRRPENFEFLSKYIDFPKRIKNLYKP
jgi:HEPN domain-containing protein